MSLILNKIGKCLKSNGGYVLVILIIMIVALGSLGLALASSTVSNLHAQKSNQRMENDYYGVDGSMNRVLAILERACAYSRYNAQKAAEEEYQYGIDVGVPLTNEQLSSIYNNSFKFYITSGNGKTYIEENLLSMKDDSLYLVEAAPAWNEIECNSDGINLKVNLKKLQRSEKLSAVFNMPYNYLLDAQKEITIVRDTPSQSMPIGFYNALFRAPFTMKANISLNDKADLRFDSSESGIAMQWVSGINEKLISTNARVDINGTTVPILEKDNTKSLQGNSTEIYTNGVKVERSTPCEASKRVSLSSYYDSSYVKQIKDIKSDGSNSYYEATEGDCVLRIYTGNASILDSNSGNKWLELNGKRGLIIIAGSLSSNSGYNLDSFSGGIVILGGGSSSMNSSMRITHNEAAIAQAIDLYKKATGSDTIEKMFKLDTLMSKTSDSEAVRVATLSGGVLFESPLTLGNSYATKNKITVDSTYPYFRIADKKFYISSSSNSLQSSKNCVSFYRSQNPMGFYYNNNIIWNKDTTEGDKSVNRNIGDLFNLTDAALLQSWINSNVAVVSRENSKDNQNILKVFTGDTTINNSGFIGNESVNGKNGLLFVNGRLTIDGGFNFDGVVIATNGINAYNGGDVKINHNFAKALDAINLSSSAVEFFAPGAVVQYETKSVYDHITPAVTIPDENLTLFNAAVTISNVRFLAPYTNASVFGDTSNISLQNSDLVCSLNVGAYANGKGLQATTNNIYTYLKLKKDSIASGCC